MNIAESAYRLSDQFAFSGNTLERRSEHRGDEKWLEAHLKSKTARFALFSGDAAVLKTNSGPSALFMTLQEVNQLEARLEQPILLGFTPGEERPVFAVSTKLDEAALARQNCAPFNLRALALQGALSPEHLGVLAQARALLHWHQTHQYCSRCGEPSLMTQGGYRRDCSNCESLHFPRTDPVAIMLIRHKDHCLLGRSPRFPEGVYSSLAGFIEPGETLEDAVRREVMEESGVAVGRIDYLASQPWPFPASLMFGCQGEAVTTEIKMDTEELEDCRWFARADVELMLQGEHPEGLKLPPPLSIAHWLIIQFLENGSQG